MSSILKRSSALPVATILSSASAMCVFYRTYGTVNEDRFYLMSSLVMGGMIPYTAYFLLPINKHFMAEGETFEDADEKWRVLLLEWKKWHLPRSIACAAMFSLAVYKLVC